MDLFRVGDKTYSHDEIIVAAELRGDLRDMRANLSTGLAAHARATEESLEVEGLQAEVNAFRKEQNLITADDTSAYFQAHDLSVEDLCDHLRRLHFTDLLEDQLTDIVSSKAPPAELIESTLWAELVFSGQLTSFAQSLAERLALRGALRGEVAVTDEERASELDRFAEALELPVSQVGQLLEERGLEATWAQELAELEALYHKTIDSLLTPRRREELLVAQRLALMLVDVDIGYFESLDAAREAHFCITQDGDSLEEVLQLAKTEGERITAFLDDLPQNLNAALLSAREGETLAPLEWEGLYVLCRLSSKQEPKLENEDVATRIDGLIVEAQLDAMVNDHVTWIGESTKAK